MIIHNINSLEFDILLKKFSEYCYTHGGRDIMLNVGALKGKEEIEESFRLFNETISFYIRYSYKLLFDMPESMDWTNRISKENLLSSRDFISILSVLKTSRSLKKTLKMAKESESPLLEHYYQKIEDMSRLETAIEKVFDDEGGIKDTASGLLKSLRKEKLSIDSEIRNKLKKFINDSNNREIIQEDFITSRNDRFVIPVNSSFFKYHKGIVQDKSSAGITFFTEPDFIIPGNNRKIEIEIEEKNEIIRILRELSTLVRERSERLINNIDIIHFLDFLFAVSAISSKQNYFIPRITDSSRVCLKNARHPLLLFIKGEEDTVPLNISIENDPIVVITGPNTGGKTVCLKTIGLLLLMANCGLPIPAGEGSKIPVLDHIMCDIGDEQDIKQDLSTFSSHISRISRFLEKANSKSLILIDEIGAGTDPKEGSALGIAILEYLREKRSIVITSTHYGTIKAFAHNRKGYFTSMVEFDKDTLRPTYRLIPGGVGRSNAIYIADKLNMKPEVINLAKIFLGEKERNLDKLIDSIEEKDKVLAERITELNKAREEFEEYKEKQKSLMRDRMLVTLEIEKRKIEELEDLLSKLKLSHKKKKKKRDDKVLEKNEIQEKQESLSDIEARVSEIKDKTETELKMIETPCEEQDTEPYIGSYINIKNMSGDFMIQDINEKTGDYEIVMNNLRMKVKRENIIKVFSREKVKSSAFIEYDDTDKDTGNAGFKINLIGLDIQSAIDRLEPFIDKAYSRGKPYLHIVHGIGEGILKDAIRKYLKKRIEIKEIVKGEDAYNNSGITEIVFY